MKIIRPKGVLVCVGVPLIMIFFVGLLAVAIYSIINGSYLIGIIGTIICCYAITILIADIVTHRIILEDTQVTITDRRYLFWFVNQGKTLQLKDLQSLQVVVTIIPGANNFVKALSFSYRDESKNDYFDITKFSDTQISQLMQDIQSNALKFCNQKVEILDEFNITEDKK
ncbi:MAG: hypothetical protein IJD47_01415 [Clostridia bacterium]|nr:hypothetical protein [Clostridia bacterium]